MALREEVLAANGSIDDVQMSLHNAVFGSPSGPAPYANADYYGEITHPSSQFGTLMAKVAVRLGGGHEYHRAPALWRLDQAMGGGKSHGLIGLWHLAAHPGEMSETDIGSVAFERAAEIVGHPLPGDLNSPRVVLLPCDNMTAGVESGGEPAKSLHERFLWRLFDGESDRWDRFVEYRDHFADKATLGQALASVGGPVLILVDEVMDYVRQLSDSALADVATRDMAFLRALLDTVNDVPNVAMVVVMIASEKDLMHLDDVGRSRRGEIESLLVRNGQTATINENTDFAAILRRRLLDGGPPTDVVAATSSAYSTLMSGSAWKSKVFDLHPQHSWENWTSEVERCYPFHPHLIALAEHEWANLAGFQRVRSTIRIFAAAIHEQRRRGTAGEWAPLLIGPGDIPLSSATAREAVIGSGLIADPKSEANYRSVATTDIVDTDDEGGTARQIDLSRAAASATDGNPRAAERAATALFLTSIVGNRPGGRQGATEVELKAAMFVPDGLFSPTDADTVVADLVADEGGLAAVERIPGRGGQPPRLFLTTRKTLNMLVRAARTTVTDGERDSAIVERAEKILTSGPFAVTRVVRVDAEDDRAPQEILSSEGLDDARKTRLVVLDPARFSLLNGIDGDTRAAIRAAFGLGPDPLPVVWASSLVFAAVNTQRRQQARNLASHFLAWQRVAAMDTVKADDQTLAEARENLRQADRDFTIAVRRAFQHLVFLAEGHEETPRVDELYTFQEENQTALDGATAWKALVERGKAFDVGTFGAQALLSNLADQDYGRPLDELRNTFWNRPRMPLLPQGEADLRRAIYEAVIANQLRIVGADGEDRTVTSETGIALNQSGLRLARPEEVEPGYNGEKGGEGTGGSGEDEGTTGGTGGGDEGGTTTTTDHEVALSLTANLTDQDRRYAIYSLLTKIAEAVDESGAAHIQLMTKVVVPEPAVENLKSFGTQAGATVSSRELPS
jgi:hypothetical protein